MMKTLKQKILISSSLFFFILYLCLTITIQREMTQTTLPLNKAATEQLVNSKSNEINSWMSERLSELSLLASTASRLDLATDDFFLETRDLEKRQPNIYDSIRLVSTNGVSKSWIAPDFTIRDRLYYKKLIQSDAPYTVSNVLDSKESKHRIVIILYPLPRPTSQQINYIAASVSTAQIENLTDELTIYDGVGELLSAEKTKNKPITSVDKLAKTEIVSFVKEIPLLPNWQLNYTVEKKELLQNGRHLQKLLIIVGCLVFAVFLIFLLFILNAFVAPITSLSKSIHKIQQGEASTRAIVYKNDEIGLLTQQFNNMLDSLEHSQKSQSYAQIRLIQEQVKPHFLYNTLDTIQWLADAGETETVSEIITALSDYFRLGLNNGSDWATLQEEQQHVASYLKIQETRYEKHINVQYHLAEETKELLVPHFLLQPLVENALYHGIRPLAEKGQKIIIDSTLTDDALLIHVKNTGKLPTKEKVKAMNNYYQQKIEEEDQSGFGLYSISYRLQLAFNPSKATLSFSISDAFFIVTITIPKGVLKI